MNPCEYTGTRQTHILIPKSWITTESHPGYIEHIWRIQGYAQSLLIMILFNCSNNIEEICTTKELNIQYIYHKGRTYTRGIPQKTQIYMYRKGPRYILPHCLKSACRRKISWRYYFQKMSPVAIPEDVTASKLRITGLYDENPAARSGISY